MYLQYSTVSLTKSNNEHREMNLKVNLLLVLKSNQAMGDWAFLINAIGERSNLQKEYKSIRIGNYNVNSNTVLEKYLVIV